jgi:hypothetical protein
MRTNLASIYIYIYIILYLLVNASKAAPSFSYSSKRFILFFEGEHVSIAIRIVKAMLIMQTVLVREP